MSFIKIRKISLVGRLLGGDIGRIEGFSFVEAPWRRPPSSLEVAMYRPRKQRAQWKQKRYGSR